MMGQWQVWIHNFMIRSDVLPLPMISVEVRSSSFIFDGNVFPNRCICEASHKKQGTNDILGKMSFWYHCQEHTFSFNLIPKSGSYSYFLKYDHLCMSPKAISLKELILRNWPLKFLIIVLDLTGYRNCRIFCGKMFENQSEITWMW